MTNSSMMLDVLPYTARRDIDILLSKSKRLNNTRWVVNVRNINLNRARRLLKSRFKIVDEHLVVNGVSQISFEEIR